MAPSAQGAVRAFLRITQDAVDQKRTRSMTGRNHSGVTEFVLLGFTHLQELLFMVFLLIYITTLVGNLGMIILIRTDPQLHTSMYFFLSHLSFLDICYSSSVTPKLLSGLLTGRNVISFNGCVTQFFFYAVFITTEAIFLAIMAYDRYVAICQPLHYVVVMSHRVRVRLVVGSYTAGGLSALVHTAGLLRLSFCGPNVVNHFYCEIPPLLLLSCSETRFNEVVMVSCAVSCHHHSPGHPHLLHLHPARRLEHPLCGGQAQGLLHLHFPSVGRCPLLWLCSFPVPPPPLQSCRRGKENSLGFLHHGDSHAQPFHLQPEECEGEDCPQKSCEDVPLLRVSPPVSPQPNSNSCHLTELRQQNK
uniref:Olfactory receptor n=1 Tax=Anser cygnoides TaxID=8845 RepID=A0A8B9II61_ANSCY